MIGFIVCYMTINIIIIISLLYKDIKKIIKKNKHLSTIDIIHFINMIVLLLFVGFPYILMLVLERE